jgi:hypothetical protein
MEWTFVVMESVREMLTRVGLFIPKLIGVLVVLIVGLLISKTMETVVVRALKLIRVDTLSEKSGTSAFLAKGGIKSTLSELIGKLVYWLLIIIVIMTALNVLHWVVAANLLNSIITYIPSIIAAIFIIVIGMFAATLLGTAIRTAAINAGIEQAKLLGQITQAVIIVFVALVALEQLRIQTGVIVNIINILVAAVALAAGLAFGLGCKDVAGKAVEDFLNNLKKK